jgi:nucleoside-diphosphate-sugar epimerase
MSQHVLLTGANGFLGTHILSQLLAAGFHVRSIVRSQSKADQLSSIFPAYASKMDFGIVPDMTIPGAFNAVVQSSPPFTTVLHQASPFFFASITKNEDFLLPAVQGTTNLLKSIKEFAPEVKRVIYTSSCAAVINFDAPIATEPQKIYTDEDWNPVTYAQAMQGNKAIAYRASKKFAELAGWNFISEEKPNFDFVSINPPMIYGPMYHPASSVEGINESNARIYSNFINSKQDGEMPEGGVHMYVDVRDLAAAHVKAVTTKEAGGERVLVSSKAISSQEIADILRRNFGQLEERTPVGKAGTKSLPDGAYGISNEKARRLLGVSFRSDEECFVDLGRQLLEIEREGK